LNDILRSVTRQYDAEARRRKQRVELLLQENLPVPMGDPLALERVFANLVHNALKFTPEIGQITLRSFQRDDAVVGAVADTGPGIAREDIERLFEKYKRVARDAHREGTGLGLFIVKALVEAHQGRIEVESTLGVGTCFSVVLPLA
jgi:signal transduction histidine kinase